MLATVLSIITPVVTKLITWYIEPKLKPISDKVKEIERDIPDIEGSLKHKELLIFIKTTPAISKFIYDCGWSMTDVDKIVKFCVLITKKPITNAKSRDKWNADDARVLFDFIVIVAQRWIKKR